MKTLFSCMLVAFLSVMGTLYAIDWQEEDLVYEITDPVFFGDVIYQNIRIGNQGWNPAENVKFQIKSYESIKEGKKEYRAYPPMNIPRNDKDLVVGGYDRIRRNEWVIVTFLSNDKPITSDTIVIKSDRSIARLLVSDDESSFGWTNLLSIFGVIFFVFMMIGVLSAIMLPAYADYKKRAAEAVRNVETKETGQI